MLYLLWWTSVFALPAVVLGFPTLKGINLRWPAREQPHMLLHNKLDVPQRGVVILEEENSLAHSIFAYDNFKFTLPVYWNQMRTKFRLWLQYPWRKLKGKVVLKIKLGGSLSIEPSEKPLFTLGSQQNAEDISSLYDLSTLLIFGAYDPRVLGVFVEVGTLQCGYAKLREARRMLEFFRQSGKKIIGYSDRASEKELSLAMGFDEYYLPPDGELGLKGFSASATFLRDALDKIGIEPQVQRIGKYKSFGDTFNRSSIAESQREVISSLLLQASDEWAQDIALQTNSTVDDIRSVWAAKGVHKPADYVAQGLITGVKYLDQVEEIVNHRFQQKENKHSLLAWIAKKYAALKNIMIIDSAEKQYDERVRQFDLTEDFEKHPRRRSGAPAVQLLNGAANSSALNATHDISASVFSANSTVTTSFANDTLQAAAPENEQQAAAERIPRMLVLPLSAAPKLKQIPGGTYLRKMSAGWSILKGLPLQEVRRGERIAIINAAGGIGAGVSTTGPTGVTLGADTLIALIRRAREDSAIKAVVLRVDSPGGEALASDLIWRELRLLSRVKPVIASQVDVAASGGYYLSMACDEIVAEQLSVTGSIGVVLAKPNFQKLLEKIGLNTETISIGRYAEVLSTTRGFTDEEAQYFEELAQQAYKSFVSKAAASRSMSFDAMQKVAQGRVWTGQQGLRNGLVDHQGGLWKALRVAEQLSRLQKQKQKQKLKLQQVPQIAATASDENDTAEDQDEDSAHTCYRVQTLSEPRSGFSRLPLLGDTMGYLRVVMESFGWLRGASKAGRGMLVGEPLALCDDAVLSAGLSSAENWCVGATPAQFWHLFRDLL